MLLAHTTKVAETAAKVAHVAECACKNCQQTVRTSTVMDRLTWFKALVGAPLVFIPLAFLVWLVIAEPEDGSLEKLVIPFTGCFIIIGFIILAL